VFAAFRDVEPAGALPRVLPDLLRSPAAQRLDLRGFDVTEVREQLSRAIAGDPDARAVLDLTGGNPLFVREVARAMADGTWRHDRPPRTVLDVVAARLDRVSEECRRLVQAAAIVGRDFSAAIVARTLEEPVGQCLPMIDEAIGHGLIDRVGDAGDHRFIHALTRQAVEASLTTAERAALHRAVAEAIEAEFAGDLHGCMNAAAAAADAAAAAGSPELLGEAALVLEAAPDAVVNAVGKELCERALAQAGG
jgi:hypothetical protein